LGTTDISIQWNKADDVLQCILQYFLLNINIIKNVK
jgi:hypothetical protein